MEARLIKTDRNGTQYFASNVCQKCGGSGYIHGYEHIDGARCWECGATGRVSKPYTWKVYTPEYAQKLADRRRQKAIAQAPEANKQFFKKIGFDESGRAWVVIGKAYDIKDALKAAGAKFDFTIGWHFDRADNGFNCFEISIADVGDKNDLELWGFKHSCEIAAFIEAKQAEHAPKTVSEYVGNIGDTITATVTLAAIHKYKTHFTYYGETNYIYKFTDESGNTLVWKTATWQEIREGETYTLKGKIKEHSEYNGDKQTVLTRCKIS
jgi:hypothetical protein